MKKIEEEEFNEYLGKRLTQIRKVNKMSIGELGAHIGVSYQQIRKYENDTNRMSPKRLLM